MNALGVWLNTFAAGPQAIDAKSELLALHKASLAAHRDNNWEFFRGVAGETLYGLQDGAITTQSPEEVGAAFEAYLTVARFTLYEDLDSPVVFVSDDGSLGWVIARVRVEGSYGEGRLDSTWSWINLFAREGASWKLVGTASTRGN
jgi:hypothetical protein